MFFMSFFYQSICYFLIVISTCKANIPFLHLLTKWLSIFEYKIENLNEITLMAKLYSYLLPRLSRMPRKYGQNFWKWTNGLIKKSLSSNLIFSPKRAIFQTFWKTYGFTKSLFFELETSNWGYVIAYFLIIFNNLKSLTKKTNIWSRKFGR